MRCVRADILDWEPDRRFALWHDRAVFHFLVDDLERGRYLRTLRRSLAPGGALIVATFGADGPDTCSGLPVRRYSRHELIAALGERFEPHEMRREEHITPRGAVQPFTWVAGRLA